MITRQSRSEEEKKLAARTVVFTILAILFFCGIIINYNSWLYKEKKNGIIKDGKLVAGESADQIDKYLSTNIDAVNLAAYSLDGLIRENSTDAEIQNNMVAQSNAIRSAVLENSTGLYGYINGRFFSGTLWEPPADYDATKRPWYTRPFDEPGTITLLDPYVDVQSGNVMIALGKTLCDGKSVVSLDVSLDRIQSMTEEAAQGSGTQQMIILNDRGIVVAHSIGSECGKDYHEESGTLGAEIIGWLDGSDEDFHEFKLDGAHYIVYDVDMQNGWHCVSVNNATDVFYSLTQLLMLTIMAVIAVVLIISIMMSRYGTRGIIAEHLSSRLSSIANIFMTAHEIDVVTDTFSEIKSDSGIVDKLVGQSRTHAQETLRKVMETVTDESSIKDVLTFIDLSTLEERLKGKDSISIEYLNTKSMWRRARFVVSNRDASGKLLRVIWLSENIDNEKKERDMLIDMSERAIAASKAKSSFLSNMSHEIRTPINAVLGMNEMILRECRDENILNYSKNIKIAGRSLLRIINDILDFSRIEAGKIEIIPVDYDVSSLLNDLVNMVQTRANEKGLKIILDFDSNIPCRLTGDEMRIKQVITNLLSNAVKYTHEGTVTFSVGYSKIPDEPDEIMINVSVKDTGTGIRKEDIEKLFIEFERFDEKRNRSIEGTGLGLSITRSVLALMGSSLEVSSIYGEGSEFSFSLKQHVADQEPLGDYKETFSRNIAGTMTYREKFIAPDARILAVDDNPMNLMVFKSLVKSTLVNVDLANNGDEGIRLSKENKYDIIFLDHMMPNKDGIETLHEIKGNTGNPNASTAFVCLTANAILGARSEYLAAGFDDYLTKPINPDILENMMQQYISPDKIMKPEDYDGAIEKEDPGDTVSREERIRELLSSLDESIINTENGIGNSGSASDYMMLLKVFCDSIDDTAAELDSYFENEDITGYTIRIHALKSSARIIGAESFAAQAELLEKAGKSGDLQYIRDNHALVISGYKSFKDLIAPVITSDNVSETVRKPADSALLKEAYKEIKEAAEDMDCGLLDEKIKEFEAYEMPDEDSALFDKLKNAAFNFEYDSIISLLENREGK